jgi:hypothetical protein
MKARIPQPAAPPAALPAATADTTTKTNLLVRMAAIQGAVQALGGESTTAEPTRTLAGIIEDAGRATCGYCWADSPQWACSFSGTGPDGLHLARFARACRRGLISEADMAIVMAAAGDVFTDGTVIFGSDR